MAYIYVITNDIDNKKYVGQTTHSIKKRLKEHIQDSKRERDRNRPLYQAINQYGAEHFKIELLEECSDEEGFTRECYWIDQLDTYNNGYNATLGGVGKPFYDYKEIADLYLKLGYVSAVVDFIGCSPEIVTAACKQNGIKVKTVHELAYDPHYSQLCSCMFGGKKVIMLDKITKKELMVFNSCGEAARYLIDTGLADNKVNTLRGYIVDTANGKRKSAAGYCWRYI